VDTGKRKELCLVRRLSFLRKWGGEGDGKRGARKRFINDIGRVGGGVAAKTFRRGGVDRDTGLQCKGTIETFFRERRGRRERPNGEGTGRGTVDSRITLNLKELVQGVVRGG